MKLNKRQKEHLLALVAEGLQSDEINLRAAKFKPAYSVSRQQVDFYRDSRRVKLDELKEASESQALRTGLALREMRVETLAQLGERLKRELLADGDAGRLWLKREKAIGSGSATKFIDEEDFNLTGLNALRAVLDDIAKEMGERSYGSFAGESDEDGAEEGAEGAPAQALTIKVEYVGGNSPDAPEPAQGATADQPGGASV
jgi:hypothetical protein